MKIGMQTSTLDINGYGRWKEEMYDKLKEHGYACSDFDMSNTDTEIYTACQDKSDEIMLYERCLALQAGIKITQVHGPWRWPAKDFTEEDRAERMEKMKKSIRATNVLGCRNWVVHPIMPYGVEDAGTENAQKTWDINVAFMTELLKEAKANNVTICLENMPMHHFSLAKPEAILKLVQTIHDDHFKICLDTGHVAVFDELDLAEEVRRLGSEIRVLHVHDNKCNEDLHLMPYFGVIDWKAFAAALKEISFEGSFSLETMPSKKLPDPIFEEMSKLLLKIAKEITE